MQTTAVIDFSVFCHQLHSVLEGVDVPPEHYPGVLKAQMAWLMSGEWLGSLKPEGFKPVLVADSKPYWRSEYLLRSEVITRIPRKIKKTEKLRQELLELLGLDPQTEETAARSLELTESLKIVYKGGRKFPEYTFTKLKKNLTEIAIAQGWVPIGKTFYEADDVAAAFCQLNQGLAKPNNIMLITVDTDWLAMLDDQTSWFCMHGWYPRCRFTLDQMNIWATKKFNLSFSQPTDLWNYKAVYGDKSDNLPAGSPLEVIDLFSPPDEHKLWQHADIRGKALDVLRADTQAPIDPRRALQYLRSLGIPPAVRLYQETLDKTA
jgi:hypothetical protein